ncbi:MAG: type VI secretion system protein TssA [Bryobacterales bacterium]|nr:type VI secretion system protein TssA [Bryobacterales bacterium]
MPESRIDIAALMAPVSPEAPCGEDLRFSLEWKKLEDAKRSDDPLDKGAWEPKELKAADWNLVARLSQDFLTRKTKDLRAGVILLEALTRLDGFPGLSGGLQLLEKLVEEYWNRGLHPLPDGENLDDRASAFDWLNTKLPDLLRDIAITARSDGGAEYTYARYLDARAVGRERDYEEGRVPSEKRDRFLKAKEEGRCLDLYDAAVSATPLAPLEQLLSEVTAALSDVGRLNRLLNGKFDPVEDAPGFSEVRNTLEEIQQQLDTVVRAKRPVASPMPGAQGVSTAVQGFVVPGTVVFGAEMSSANGASWAEAETLVRSGKVEQGLSEMARLAQRETSGRARFQRKLLLADVCLQTKRERLAQNVLEELAEQIDAHKLQDWETTDVIGAVWLRLYRVYKQASDDRAKALYLRLCRLDPWQALSCGEE